MKRMLMFLTITFALVSQAQSTPGSAPPYNIGMGEIGRAAELTNHAPFPVPNRKLVNINGRCHGPNWVRFENRTGPMDTVNTDSSWPFVPGAIRWRYRNVVPDYNGNLWTQCTFNAGYYTFFATLDLTNQGGTGGKCYRANYGDPVLDYGFITAGGDAHVDGIRWSIAMQEYNAPDDTLPAPPTYTSHLLSGQSSLVQFPAGSGFYLLVDEPGSALCFRINPSYVTAPNDTRIAPAVIFNTFFLNGSVVNAGRAVLNANHNQDCNTTAPGLCSIELVVKGSEFGRYSLTRLSDGANVTFGGRVGAATTVYLPFTWGTAAQWQLSTLPRVGTGYPDVVLPNDVIFSTPAMSAPYGGNGPNAPGCTSASTCTPVTVPANYQVGR